MRGVLTLICFLSSPAWAGATVASSGQTYATVGEAVAVAQVGDTVTVDAGTHAESVTIAADLTLVGAGIDATTITGSSASPALSIGVGATVTLRDLELDGNGATTVSVTGGDLTTDRVRLVGGEAASRGGNLAVDGGGAVLTDSEILGGTAIQSGGAIAALSGATVELIRTSVVGGSAPQGGAVYAGNSDVIFRDASVSGASASDTGGGIALLGGSTLQMMDSQVEGASAPVAGGFLWVDGTSSASLVRATICGSSAGSGAAIYAEGATDIRNSVITDSTGGAAIHFDDTAGSGNQLTVRYSNLLTNEMAIFIAQADYELSNLAFGWNTGQTILVSGGTGTASFIYEYMNAVDSSVAVTFPVSAADPPGFLDWTDNGDCSDDLFFLEANSPLVDAGDPGQLDLDGTVSDVGASGGPDADPDLWLDNDNDGTPMYWDCDDTAANVYPGAVEYCGGVDHDCDGAVNEPDSADVVRWYADADGDTYGDFNDSGTLACEIPGAAETSTDCDDGNPAIHPDAPEVCYDGVGVDSNCDGDPAAGAVDAGSWTQDRDGDSYGDDRTAVDACTAPGNDWVLEQGGDCDDNDDTVHPGAVDATCDGVDDNCSGDESETAGWRTFYRDLDGDGHGDTSRTATGCANNPPANYSELSDDCNDSDPTISPDGTEVCDAVDNDCNGTVDDGTPVVTWYADDDQDGFGDGSNPVTAFCPPVSSWIQADGDCDDDQADVNPDADEVCDGVDNDCDADVDVEDADLTDASVGYTDVDGDGYGVGDPITTCDATGLAPVDGDCADTIPEINPGAREVAGNSVDENCDGEAEPGPTTTPTTTDDDKDTTGCACDHGAPSTPAFLSFLLPLIALRRRGERTC